MFIALNNVHQGYRSVNSSAVHMECWTKTFGRMVQIAMLPFSNSFTLTDSVHKKVWNSFELSIYIHLHAHTNYRSMQVFSSDISCLGQKLNRRHVLWGAHPIRNMNETLFESLKLTNSKLIVHQILWRRRRVFGLAPDQFYELRQGCLWGTTLLNCLPCCHLEVFGLGPNFGNFQVRFITCHDLLHL